MRRWLLVAIAFFVGAAVGAGVLFSRLDRYPDGSMHWHHSDVRVDYFPPPPVIVAVQDLPVGAVLRDDLLAVRRIPEQFVQDGLAPEQLASVRGMTVLAPLIAGEPVRRARLGATGTIESACSELVTAVNAKQTDVARAKLETVRALVPR